MIGVEPDHLKQLFGKLEPSERRNSVAHKLAQERLCQLGKELGFGVIAEYLAPDLAQIGRNSYVDVVWIEESKIAVAFEIHVRDSARCLLQPTGRKDIEKLRKLRACRKFIVNFSPSTGEAFFHRI